MSPSAAGLASALPASPTRRTGARFRPTFHMPTIMSERDASCSDLVAEAGRRTRVMQGEGDDGDAPRVPSFIEEEDAALEEEEEEEEEEGQQQQQQQHAQDEEEAPVCFNVGASSAQTPLVASGRLSVVEEEPPAPAEPGLESSSFDGIAPDGADNVRALAALSENWGRRGEISHLEPKE